MLRVGPCTDYFAMQLTSFMFYTSEAKNLFGLIYISPIDAKERMLIFRLVGDVEKRDWLDELIKALTESNCIADTVS